jgi:23S rRNA (guanine1835-N2)-methyltransferase
MLKWRGGSARGKKLGWQSLEGRELTIGRWPPQAADRLQAWDAADEYFLHRLREQPVAPGARVLLVDDHWGALGVALAGLQPVAWGDSHLGRLALAANLRADNLAAEAVPFVPSTDLPVGPFDLALVRIAKDLDAFSDTLRRLREVLAPGAEVVAGGMIKHTPTRAWRLLESLIGPAPTTPGWKKARLGSARFTAPPPGPVPESTGYELAADGLALCGAPGVFGGGRLDGGAALLLRHLPAVETPLTAVDLGSGDGVLALALARRCPRAQVLGVDASHRAVACARANLARNGGVVGDASRVAFNVGDGLADAQPATLDLVVCNPPFHDGHAVADVAAARLFAQARAALRPGGRLLVVGNRHLGHHAKIDRIFGSHELVDGDARFVVLAATRGDGPA